MKNKKTFMEFMTLMGEIHNTEISEIVLKTYWQILKPFSDEKCEKAFVDITKYSKYFPKPIDLLIRLEERVEDRALQAWLKTRETIVKFGYYDSIEFDDPTIHSVVKAMGGWMKLSEELPADFSDSQWYEKEFVKLYNIYSRRQNHPKYLPGCHEIESNVKGGPANNIKKVITGYMKPQLEDIKEPKKLSYKKGR